MTWLVAIVVIIHCRSVKMQTIFFTISKKTIPPPPIEKMLQIWIVNYSGNCRVFFFFFDENISIFHPKILTNEMFWRDFFSICIWSTHNSLSLETRCRWKRLEFNVFYSSLQFFRIQFLFLTALSWTVAALSLNSHKSLKLFRLFAVFGKCFSTHRRINRCKHAQLFRMAKSLCWMFRNN